MAGRDDGSSSSPPSRSSARAAVLKGTAPPTRCRRGPLSLSASLPLSFSLSLLPRSVLLYSQDSVSLPSLRQRMPAGHCASLPSTPTSRYRPPPPSPSPVPTSPARPGHLETDGHARVRPAGSDCGRGGVGAWGRAGSGGGGGGRACMSSTTMGSRSRYDRKKESTCPARPARPPTARRPLRLADDKPTRPAARGGRSPAPPLGICR